MRTHSPAESTQRAVAAHPQMISASSCSGRRRDRVRRGAWLLLALGLFGSGCAVGRAAGVYSEIPRERTTECQEICTKLDLQLAAVVVVLNTTGCVCEPKNRATAPAVSSLAGPAAVGTTANSGGAAVAAAQVVATVTAQQQQRVLR